MFLTKSAASSAETNISFLVLRFFRVSFCSKASFSPITAKYSMPFLSAYFISFPILCSLETDNSVLIPFKRNNFAVFKANVLSFSLK